jgi:hypothetical protein
MKDFSKEINGWRAFLAESKSKDATIISDDLVKSRKEISEANGFTSNDEFFKFITKETDSVNETN